MQSVRGGGRFVRTMNFTLLPPLQLYLGLIIVEVELEGERNKWRRSVCVVDLKQEKETRHSEDGRPSRWNHSSMQRRSGFGAFHMSICEPRPPCLKWFVATDESRRFRMPFWRLRFSKSQHSKRATFRLIIMSQEISFMKVVLFRVHSAHSICPRNLAIYIYIIISRIASSLLYRTFRRVRTFTSFL